MNQATVDKWFACRSSFGAPITMGIVYLKEGLPSIIDWNSRGGQLVDDRVTSVVDCVVVIR